LVEHYEAMIDREDAELLVLALWVAHRRSVYRSLQA